MYKMIIADDEKIIQKGLTQLINWKELGFEVVKTFDDGTEVIDYLESMPVDVVLTDIKMTHIGGVEVARYVKESELPCKVVFVSGHKEFELALAAIRYGVKDYILKPSKKEDVKKVFQKIRLELEANAKDLELQCKVKRYWDEMYPVMTEKFVGNLLMGVLDNQKDVEQRMQILYPEVNVETCPCVLADMEIKDYETFIQSKWNYSLEQFDDAIYNFIKMYAGLGHVYITYKHKEEFRLFIIMKEYALSEIQNVLICEKEVRNFVREFTEIFQSDIVLKTKKVFKNIYEVMESKQTVIEMNSRKDETELYLQEQKKMIFTNILTGNISSAQKMVNNLLKNLAADDMRYRMHFMMGIFSGISELLRENNAQLFQVVGPYIDYYNIMNMNTVRELEQYCDKIFNKMKSEAGMSDHFDNESLVNKIKEYVERNIYEDITLEDVANEIFISTSHLSRVFKKKTGKTFLQYTTERKMEKAIELLQDPRQMVYQIGQKLGYKTPRYFSKLFCRYSGYYPSQYRREVLKMREVADEEI